MGRAAASKPELAGRQGAVAVPAPALRVVSTPAEEVDTVCRLTLATFLAAGEQSVPPEALQRLLLPALDGPPTPPTPIDLADWQALHDRLLTITILDPACGEGHFLAGMLEVLDQLLALVEQRAGRPSDRNLRRRHILRHALHGVDVQRAPLREARTRLLTVARLDPSLEYPRVNLVCLDALLAPHSPAWKAAFPAQGDRGFDLIIANPPYVRHESIVDPTGLVDAAGYKGRVLIETYRRWPEFFGWDERAQRAANPLDGRSDLCIPFVFLACSLLTARGAIGMVLPSGLFQAQYGRAVRSFLAGHGWESWVGDTPTRGSGFQAHINTALMFTSRPARSSPRRGTLRELELTGLSSSRAWAQSRAAVSTSAGAAANILAGLPGITALNQVCRVRYPIKTGLNAFFYPSAEIRERFKIEPEFCRPVVKSPRDVISVAISAKDCSTVAFVCDLEELDLAERGCTGALSYIAWARRQRLADGTAWPEVRSLHGRQPWYRLPLPAPADLLCPRFFDRRFFFAVPEPELLEDQTFYGLVASTAAIGRQPLPVLAGILNSSFTALALESGGRTGLGDGVRQYALADLASLPVLSPVTLNPRAVEEVSAIYQSLSVRPIQPIAQEIDQADRRALDELIARAAGISAVNLRRVRTLLTASVERRLERAQEARRGRLSLTE